MTKSKKILFGCLLTLSFVPLIYLYSVATQFGFLGPWVQAPAVTISQMTMERNGATSDITLPSTLMDGRAGEPIVLSTQLEDASGQLLYIKSVYAPLQVYANDQLLYDFGDASTYPSYLKDPSVLVAIVNLPNDSTIDLRLAYEYPSSRRDLILEPPLVGTYPSIFSTLLSFNENIFFLYTFFITFGLLLLCIGLFVGAFENQGYALLWMGFIILCCGLWGTGEYDISGIFIQNENLLYLMAFTGAFYLPVPMHFYFRACVHYHNSRHVTICGLLCLLVAVTSCTLQAFGGVSFYNLLPYFIVFAISSFVFGAGYTLYEWRTYDNKMAQQFFILWSIVIVALLLELIRFLRGTVNAYGLFIQLGLLAFILASSIIGGLLIRNSLAIREENRRMEQARKLMEVQALEQQRYHRLLLETRQSLREQRHDLRHQLAVILDFAKEENLDKVRRHLQSLEIQIPQEPQPFCENMAVNALVGYYSAKAQDAGITITIQLVVPEPSERISDNHLCVIFGNILENALEACQRIDNDGKFIILTSHIRNGMLVITQKNSFNGHFHCKEGIFYSAKRNERGIGLASVQSVAQKHGGNATFTAEERVFHSAIYVRI